MGIIPLDQQEAALEIEGTPLEGKKFAQPQSGPGHAEEQRVILGGMASRRGEEDGDFFPCDRVYLSASGDFGKELSWFQPHVDGDHPVF